MGKKRGIAASSYDDTDPPTWRIPTAEWPMLMEIKAGYHRAIKAGKPRAIAKALKAWQDFLRVPKQIGE